MNIERLKDEAAMFLEEMHVSGDAMVDMDHCLDELSEDKQGAYYLHDLMALFCEQRQDANQHDTVVNRLRFKEWLRQVTQLDSRVRHLLHQDLPYYEFSDWIDWYDNGLTPEQAISENQRQYG